MYSCLFCHREIKIKTEILNFFIYKQRETGMKKVEITDNNIKHIKGEYKMKKIFIIIISVFMLSGCTGNDRTESLPSENPPSATPTAQVTEEPKALEEPETVTEPAPVLLAQAKTELLNKDNDRVHNILLAADKLNGYELSPGEVFSFNEVLGNRTAEKGYREATVYVKGKEEEECGGGVCQVSTTLYQAADAAGLSVIERHNHQKAVAYAEQGTDAAVNYGTLDMQFKNNTKKKLRLSVWAKNGIVAAEIYQLPD